MNTPFPRTAYELGWHNATIEGVNDFQKQVKAQYDQKIWQEAYEAGQEDRKALDKQISKKAK